MLTGRKLPLTLAFVVLIGLAIGAGCKGFFVKPTLSSIAVGPANPTIETGNTGNTQQFTAVGTYNDGSTGNPSVSWTSSDVGAATINNSGLAAAVSLGSTTITATSNDNPAITGTTSLTVTVGCITSIAVTPTNPIITSSDTQQFKAEAATCNGSFDITTVATWASSNTSVATIDSSGLATPGTTTGTTNITATSGNIVSNTAVLTVTQ